MRVGPVPEGLLDWLFNRLGYVPRAMLDTYHSLIIARCIMIGTKIGVFEVLADGPKDAAAIANATSSNPRALEALLNVLAASEYLTLKQDLYGLCTHTRRFLLRSSPNSIHDNLLMRYLEWDGITNLDEFVKTGQPMELHDHLPAEHWPVYQRGMKSVARLSVPEVVSRTPLPRRPRRMLDIGGSHGLYSVGFCRKYPQLESVILDLPEAIEHAAPLLAEEGMGPQVVHRPGNALTDPLGEQEWDFVFVSQLMHHFTDKSNQELCRRIHRALRPGGLLAIVDFERVPKTSARNQMGAVFDLYFAAASRSGTWTSAEMQSWQVQAGMKPKRPISLRMTPGLVIIPAEAVAKSETGPQTT